MKDEKRPEHIRILIEQNKNANQCKISFVDADDNVTLNPNAFDTGTLQKSISMVYHAYCMLKERQTYKTPIPSKNTEADPPDNEEYTF